MTRKVEQLAISFLRQNITGRASANTVVEPHPLHPQRLQVKLHGHAIATYTPFAERAGPEGGVLTTANSHLPGTVELAQSLIDYLRLPRVLELIHI